MSSAFAQAPAAPAPVSAPKVGLKADAAADADAEKARKERESRVPTVVQEAEREKVDVKAQPVLTYEDQRRGKEFQVASKRKELIQYLDQILKENPPEEEKPDLYFQKAELFFEEGQFHFFEGMRLDDGIAEAMSTGNDPKTLELSEKKDKALEIAKRWGGDAIKIYEIIEKKYPKYERMPDVLYAMGQAYWDRQDYKESLKIYRRLIKEYPKAQYIADAWLAFGEFYFQVAPDDERDVQKALNSYIEAAKFQDSPIFGYATYKQGWCYYNLARHNKAAEKFKEVILYSQVNSQILGERRIGLAKEARKDYVLAYSQYGTAQAAPPEFKTVADNDKDLRAMLERLADLYYGDGKDRDAIIAYQTLMKSQPDNTKNPLFQGKIVKLASRIGEKRQVVGQARKLSDEFKRVRAVFANVKAGDPKREEVGDDLKAADDVSDNILRYLATTWHNEAKKTLDNTTFEYAYELYGDYLELFPDRKEAYEIRFFYAELLYRLERFEQAGEQYAKVFLQDKKGKWAEAAAEEAVRAYDEVVKDYDRQNKGKIVLPAMAAGQKPAGQPIPEVKKKLLGASKSYIEAYPKGKIVVESKYKIARVLWEYLYFDESTPRFIEFVESFPEHPRAVQAANLVLDTYAQLEDYDNLNKVARGFRANGKLIKDDTFKTLLDDIVENSSFKKIAKFEQQKQWAEAGKGYLAFAEEFPKSQYADKALANAAATFTRAGQLDRAIKVRIKLVSDYKDSSLVPDQIFAVAASYEQIVAYKDAAAWLEKFVLAYPKDSRAKDALFNASIYRHGTGDTKGAVEDREKYLKSYPEAADKEDVAYSIATAWEENGNLKKAVEAYDDFADRFRKSNPSRALNSNYKAFKLREKARVPKPEMDKCIRNLDVLGAGYRKAGKPLDEVGDPLALIAFRNADAVLDRYKALKIAKPDKPADFKKTLEGKRKAKEAVDAAYLEVVKLKSPDWAVASLFRNGEATADLVKSILAVPPPKGLTEEQSQLFKSKLEEQTLPLEEAAANYMVLCLDKSAEFAVFNEWTRRCLGYLEENRPNTYPKNQIEQRDPVKVTSHAVDVGTGMILELPGAGEKPKVTDGTQPPALPTDTKVTVPVSTTAAAPKKDDMNFGDGG